MVTKALQQAPQHELIKTLGNLFPGEMTLYIAEINDNLPGTYLPNKPAFK